MTCVDPNPILLLVSSIATLLLLLMAVINMRGVMKIRVLRDQATQMEEQTRAFINENDPRQHHDAGYREGLAMRARLDEVRKERE